MRGIRIAVVVFGGLAVGPGCGLSARELPFVEREDVVWSVPAARAGAEAVHGDAHELVADTTAAVDLWIGDVVDTTAGVVAELGEYRETRRDGAYRIYGPFDDRDDRELAWLVKLDEGGDTARFEIWVGPLGADEDGVELAVQGHVTSDAQHRSGEVDFDYDVIDRHRDLRPEGEHLAGAVTVVFERARDSDAAVVELRFAEFVRADDSAAAWDSADAIAFDRDADGAGSLHATFPLDDAWATGVIAELDVAHIELDARWDASDSGRTRARALRSANPDSALSESDLLVHECFDPQGGLTFRALNEPYAADRPSYGFGDPASCVFADADLDES